MHAYQALDCCYDPMTEHLICLKAIRYNYCMKVVCYSLFINYPFKVASYWSLRNLDFFLFWNPAMGWGPKGPWDPRGQRINGFRKGKILVVSCSRNIVWYLLSISLSFFLKISTIKLRRILCFSLFFIYKRISNIQLKWDIIIWFFCVVHL